MTPLRFGVVGAWPAAESAAPAVIFRLRLEREDGERIHCVALRASLQIEPRSRRYGKDEQARLFELFGSASQWDRTVRPFVWLQSSVVVPAFDRHIEIDLPVPCTYDLQVAASKYLHALREGDIPLRFLFSGTVFMVSGGRMAVEPVPWDCEATHRMPAQVWHDTMSRFFPGGGWIRLRRDTLDRLQAFRGERAVVDWDEAVLLLLLQGTADREAV